MRHVVNKQTEMQDAVKKEDSSDDEDDNPMNISNESLKQEIKSKDIFWTKLILEESLRGQFYSFLSFKHLI